MARKHAVIDQSRYKKWSSKENWKEREYSFHNDSDFAHKCVKMFYNTNQFPSLPFCGPHTKLHCVRGLGKHYHMVFDQKLGHGIYSIFRIPYTCAEYIYMLYKP